MGSTEKSYSPQRKTWESNIPSSKENVKEN